MTKAARHKGGRPVVELSARTKQRIRSALEKTGNVSQTVIAVAAKGDIVTNKAVRKIAAEEGIALNRSKLKVSSVISIPHPAGKRGRPRLELAPRLRNRIVSALKKTRNIALTVATLAAKGESVSADRVRDVARAEEIALGRNERLEKSAAVLELATSLREVGLTARMISAAIKSKLAVKVSPHYINTLLRRAAK